jgi:hypothetical protein
MGSCGPRSPAYLFDALQERGDARLLERQRVPSNERVGSRLQRSALLVPCSDYRCGGQCGLGRLVSHDKASGPRRPEPAGSGEVSRSDHLVSADDK